MCLDSSGLRFLIELNERAQSDGWRLTLVAPRHEAAKIILRTTCAGTALPFEPEVEELWPVTPETFVDTVRDNVWGRIGFDPHTGKRRIHDKPNRAEQMACRPWLESEIAIVKPRALVLMGATAAQSLLGSSFRVTQYRGVEIPSDLAELVTATIHPSAVLRGDDREQMFAGLVDDLRFVAERL